MAHARGGVRAKATGFVYAFSRITAMLNAVLTVFVLRTAGVAGAFAFIVGAHGVVIAAIGLFGPRTRDRALE